MPTMQRWRQAAHDGRDLTPQRQPQRRAHRPPRTCRHRCATTSREACREGRDTMRIVTVDEMAAIETRAETEAGLSIPDMMEHAGRSAAEALRAYLAGVVAGRAILVLVGPGNNGGDGRVMGRFLAEWGAHVTLYGWKERRLEVDKRFIPVNDDLLAVREGIPRAGVVVEALLGTGHSRPLDPTMRRLLALVAEERRLRPDVSVLALDLPSGLNADTGAGD